MRPYVTLAAAAVSIAFLRRERKSGQVIGVDMRHEMIALFRP